MATHPASWWKWKPWNQPWFCSFICLSDPAASPTRSALNTHPQRDHFSPPSLPTPWSEPLSSPLDYHQDITWIPLPDSTSALYSLFSALQPDWYLWNIKQYCFSILYLPTAFHFIFYHFFLKSERNVHNTKFTILTTVEPWTAAGIRGTNPLCSRKSGYNL